MGLYRYLTFEAAVATLSKGTVKLTPPAEFNDPFDMSPSWSSKLTFTEIAKAYFDLAYGSGLSLTQFIKAATSDPAQLARAAQNSFAAHANKRFGAVCFSHHFDSIPMWAYYGASHTGVVIEFNEKEAEFSRKFGPLLKDVEYNNDRPIFEGVQNAELEKLYMKSAAWSHESEARIICPLTMQGIHSGSIGNKPAWFLEFPKQSVKGVYLGCRISQARQAMLCHSLASWGYPEIHRWKLMPDEHRFELTPVEARCLCP